MYVTEIREVITQGEVFLKLNSFELFKEYKFKIPFNKIYKKLKLSGRRVQVAFGACQL